jgi:PAS domain S-box-containing protein
MKKISWQRQPQRLRVLIRLGILLALGLFAPSAIWSQDTNISPQTIRVVMDYDYPPYIFLDSEGHPRGILPDLWHLWEEKTGIHVQIHAMDWEQAQQRMQSGEYDIIDTIFKTPEREKIYAFSKPYAKIDVPIFYRSDISGIRNVQDLKGFSVAVKAGDSDIDVLISHGITTLSTFNSYEQIIAAARDHKVNVFVVDKPPAFYYLYKFGINDQFRETAPLYSGEFHRAVLQGNEALLHTVEEGFARIPQSEYEKIVQRWYGKPVFNSALLHFLLTAALLTGSVLLFLFAWIWILRRSVQKKTSALQKEIHVRIEQEKIIRESEEKYRILIEQSPDPIALFTREGMYKYANKSLAEGVGRDLDDILGRSIWDIFPHEEAEQRYAAITQVFQTGERKFLDLHVPLADGSRDFLTTITPIKDGAGNVISALSFSKDITDRIKAEKLLRESEKKFRQVFDYANDAIYVLDTKGQMLEANPVACERLGYSRQELTALNLGQIDAPNQVRHIPERISQLKEKGQVVFDTVHVRKDGSSIPVEVSARMVVWDDHPAIVSICRDISDRKQFEEKLLESEKKLSMIFKLCPDPIIVSRLGDGLICDINEAFTRDTGFNREDVIGKKSVDVGIWLEKSDREQMLRKVGHKGHVDNFEAQRRRKDGSIFNVLISASVIPLQGESHLISVIRDITEHKMLEKEQMKIEKLESLGILAGGIAHDFNNVLMGIMGNISFAKVFLDEKHRSYSPLAEAEKATVRAGQLAHQLLTFSRGGEPIKQVISLQQLVNESISLVLRGTNVKGVIDIPDSVYALEADEGQMSQVLNNLIINAVQAMPKGGTVTISAGNTCLLEDNPLSLPAGDYIRLSLADQGCGILEEDLERVFDPYFTTKTDGNGLGLSSVYSIIHRHKGHISVASTLGKGTTFIMHLPAIGTVQEKHTSEESSKELVEFQGGPVLVMDDDEVIREIAINMLAHLGFEVTACSSGEEAVQLYDASRASGKPFLVVIMDLTVPGGFGGKEAAERILSRHPDACLIVSSGYSNDPVMAHFREYGFRAAIAKPYNIKKFQDLLKVLIGYSVPM